MIEGILNNIINSATITLYQNKDKILDEAKKRGQEEVLKELPSPDEFRSSLQSAIQEGDEANLSKIQSKYNQSIGLVNKAINKLEATKRGLTNIQDKLIPSPEQEKNSIGDKMIKISNLQTNIFNPIIVVLNAAIIAVEVGLALSTSPAANGSTINKLGELKKDIKDFLKRIASINASVGSVTSFFNDEINKLTGPLGIGIQKIEELIEQLRNLLELLEGIFAEFEFEILSQNELDKLGFNKPEDIIISQHNEDGTSNLFPEEETIGNEGSNSLVFKRLKD